MNNQVRLDCQACKANASMSPAKIFRFGTVLQAIGIILLIPSFLGMGLAALLFISFVSNAAAMAPPTSDAAAAGAAIGSGIVIVFIGVVGIVSFVGGLLGWLLLSRRSVFLCGRCSFILDRA